MQDLTAKLDVVKKGIAATNKGFRKGFSIDSLAIRIEALRIRTSKEAERVEALIKRLKKVYSKVDGNLIGDYSEALEGYKGLKDVTLGWLVSSIGQKVGVSNFEGDLQVQMIEFVKLEAQATFDRINRIRESLETMKLIEPVEAETVEIEASEAENIVATLQDKPATKKKKNASAKKEVA